MFFLFCHIVLEMNSKHVLFIGLFLPETEHVRNTSNFFRKPICSSYKGGAEIIITHSPDATDAWVWVTVFLQLCSPGPCAGGSSHPVSLCCLVHLQTSSEPGKRGSSIAFKMTQRGFSIRRASGRVKKKEGKDIQYKKKEKGKVQHYCSNFYKPVPQCLCTHLSPRWKTQSL